MIMPGFEQSISVSSEFFQVYGFVSVAGLRTIRDQYMTMLVGMPVGASE